MPSTPHVSVVIPTFERSALLRLCIESFDAQTHAPNFEVVVVDDGSTDDTVTTLESLAADRSWLRWCSQPSNRGPAAARNRGLAEAQGDLLLFVDDDIVASPTLVGSHTRWHERTDDDRLAVLGRVDWHSSLEVTPFMRWLDRSGLQFAYDTWLREGPVPPAAAFYTANLSLPRRLVTDAGGFDERFPFAAYEDLEIATRLTDRGLRMDYRPDALAYHRRAIDLQTFAQRMTRVGESAELMRAISPEFEIDDNELRSRRPGRTARLKTRLAMLAGRVPASDDYFWAVVADAYRLGIDAGRRKAIVATASRHRPPTQSDAT